MLISKKQQMEISILEEYRKYRLKKTLLLIFGVTFLPFVFVWSLRSGSIEVSLLEIWNILIGRETKGTAYTVIMYSRLPQVLAALMAGAGLAVSGTGMQSILRNPLCSPFTLGISAAGAFGAALVVFLGNGSVHLSANSVSELELPGGSVMFGAFVSCAIASVLILALSTRRNITNETIILIGVALSAFYGAGLMLLQFFANEQQLAAMVYWTFGDTVRADWNSIPLIAVILTVSSVYFITQGWNYNALSLGEEAAHGLGVPIRKTRAIGMFFASLLTAVLVATLGIIGFIGLIVPHIARLLIGSDTRFVIPFSLILGAIFLLFTDTLARTAISENTIPVSILTAFLGAPIFLVMLLHKK